MTDKPQDSTETVIRICNEMRNWDAHSWMDGASHEHMVCISYRLEAAYRTELKYLHEINQDLLATLKMALDNLAYYKQLASTER